ncbi:MAG: TA system VapC family ribonuclease toxin [Gammaproteobacteria bacterium]
MRALFDVNVLIALFDPAHVHHERAHQWLEVSKESGWATCPVTQNGCVRILSQPRYPNAISVPEAIGRLGDATSQPQHEFWHDDVSIVDAGLFSADRILSARQLTDLYLLALAIAHQGRLITFDKGIPLIAVTGARTAHLVIL